MEKEVIIQEYGIANLKKFITLFGAQVHAAARIDADGDGEISTMEWTSFGGNLVIAVMSSVGVVQGAFPEAKDIRGEEWNQLIEHIIATDLLPNEKEEAEALLDKILLMIAANIVFVREILALAKK